MSLKKYAKEIIGLIIVALGILFYFIVKPVVLQKPAEVQTGHYHIESLNIKATIDQNCRIRNLAMRNNSKKMLLNNADSYIKIGFLEDNLPGSKDTWNLLNNRTPSKIQFQRGNVKRTIWVEENSLFIEDELPKGLIAHKSVTLQSPITQETGVMLYEQNTPNIKLGFNKPAVNADAKMHTKLCTPNNKNSLIWLDKQSLISIGLEGNVHYLQSSIAQLPDKKINRASMTYTTSNRAKEKIVINLLPLRGETLAQYGLGSVRSYGWLGFLSVYMCKLIKAYKKKPPKPILPTSQSINLHI